MNQKIGYIDEYGDKSINYKKSGVSTFFIVTAIIIDSVNEEKFSNEVNLIRTKYTQAPEIKSKNFSDKDFKKRVELLEDLVKLDFHVYSIIVDKRKIWENSGLAFRNTFFKYLNKLLDFELYRYYPFLDIVADEHGDDKFMSGFVDYFAKEHFQGDLFKKSSFRFAKSHDVPLIQVADLISGSLAKFFDPKKAIDEADQILNILKPKVLHLREWPEIPHQLFRSIKNEDSQYDSEIAEFSTRIISNYVIEFEKSNDEVIIQQVITLNYLIFRFKNNPFEYVFTDEIIKIIMQRAQSTFSVQLFRNKVIANLRDKGIIIVSGQTGYKIPCSKADLISHFNRNSHIINPMLSRLESTNRLIKIATDNKIDILAFDEFKELEEMILINKKNKK